LTEAEKALLKAGDERISKREETLKLQFADAEIKEKAFEASGGAKRVQERATKAAFAQKERSEKAAQRENMAGDNKVKMQMAEDATMTEERGAMDAMVKAKNELALAGMDKTKDQTKTTAFKEKQEKRSTMSKEELEIDTKKTKAEDEKMQKFSLNEGKEITAKKETALMKEGAESTAKGMQKAKERAAKAHEKQSAKQKTAEIAEKGVSEKIHKLHARPRQLAES